MIVSNQNKNNFFSQKQRNQINQVFAEIDEEIGLNKIDENLTLERLQKRLSELEKKSIKKKKDYLWPFKWVYKVLSMPVAVATSFSFVIGLSFLNIWQLETNKKLLSQTRVSESSNIIVRGNDEKEKIFKYVNSPIKEAKIWQNELLNQSLEYRISFENSNRILIRIRLTEKADEFLYKKRILFPAGDWGTLVLEKKK